MMRLIWKEKNVVDGRLFLIKILIFIILGIISNRLSCYQPFSILLVYIIVRYLKWLTLDKPLGYCQKCRLTALLFENLWWLHGEESYSREEIAHKDELPKDVAGPLSLVLCMRLLRPKTKFDEGQTGHTPLQPKNFKISLHY